MTPCRFRADVPNRSLRTLIASNVMCVNALRPLYADIVRRRVTANNCPSKTLGICVFRYNQPDARRVYQRRMWREPWWTDIRVHVTNPKLAIEAQDVHCQSSRFLLSLSLLALSSFPLLHLVVSLVCANSRRLCLCISSCDDTNPQKTKVCP